jgi:hypothetical protein
VRHGIPKVDVSSKFSIHVSACVRHTSDDDFICHENRYRPQLRGRPFWSTPEKVSLKFALFDFRGRVGHATVVSHDPKTSQENAVRKGDFVWVGGKAWCSESGA